MFVGLSGGLRVGGVRCGLKSLGNRFSALIFYLLVSPSHLYSSVVLPAPPLQDPSLSCHYK